jgi:hypothetical protein
MLLSAGIGENTIDDEVDLAEERNRRMRNVAVWIVVIVALFLLTALLWLKRNTNTGWDVRPTAQLHTIDAALELFNNDFGGYPPSGAVDDANRPYCGAMKLAEATLGRDLMGFHAMSRFRLDGADPNSGQPLYAGHTPEMLKYRKGPYLQPENARAYRLVDVYGKGHTGPFREDMYVLCDTYEKKRPSGKKTGMPILYYRANVKATAHDANDPNSPANIYNYRDNQALVELGVPGDPKGVHPLANPRRFYLNTRSEKDKTTAKPCRADSYILLSAGYDGLYGTADDVCNFEWKYPQP